jgi:hypothetical protein
MSRTVRGRIQGQTVELDEDPGLAEWQELEIMLETAGPSGPGARASRGRPAPW